MVGSLRRSPPDLKNAWTFLAKLFDSSTLATSAGVRPSRLCALDSSKKLISLLPARPSATSWVNCSSSALRLRCKYPSRLMVPPKVAVVNVLDNGRLGAGSKLRVIKDARAFLRILTSGCKLFDVVRTSIERISSSDISGRKRRISEINCSSVTAVASPLEYGTTSPVRTFSALPRRTL